MNVGIYVYNQAEVLDFSGPFEVFSTASRISKNNPFNVFLIGESNAPVLARAGYCVTPQYSIDDHPTLDVLIIAGGVHDDEMNKLNILSWIATQARNISVIASVCTGAFILAAAKVITTERVTTHWQDIEPLRKQFPRLEVIPRVRWVDEGKVITSAGITAGIDMSLYLVSKLHSKTLAENTAKQMDFVWTGCN
ncbi:DJ-1/PfpI family protein [Flocculibacter collagenilyticus]|uniref:DJ-1/PfpI family protein n=1 Tax=Flocculibacter collagenilyticus TaxID=2744479 RepID=UPI0018F66A96|nr:DJ-1/PfpI family protein [Flocculibacter collagenilyticus]